MLPIRPESPNYTVLPYSISTGKTATALPVTAGASEVPSAIVEMRDAIKDGFILTTLCTAITATLPGGSGGVRELVKIELLIGPSGFEVPVGTVWGTGAGFIGNTLNLNDTLVKYGFCQRVRPTRIPAGQRLSVRATAHGTVLIVTNIYAAGILESQWAELQRRNRYDEYLQGSAALMGRQSIYPLLTGATVTAHATAWLFGGGVEIITAAQNEMWVEGFFIDPDVVASNPSCVLEVGIGPAGGEIWQTGGPAAGKSAGQIFSNGPHYFPLPIYVRPGERVAVRLKCATGGAAPAVHLLIQEMN